MKETKHTRRKEVMIFVIENLVPRGIYLGEIIGRPLQDFNYKGLLEITQKAIESAGEWDKDYEEDFKEQFNKVKKYQL